MAKVLLQDNFQNSVFGMAAACPIYISERL